MLDRIVSWLTKPSKPKAERDHRWPAARAAHLKLQPCCQVCGGQKCLQVHHVLPVHFPGGKARELDPMNMITLCEAPAHDCHLIFGHLGNWKARNPHVRTDAAWWWDKIRNRQMPLEDSAGE